jgi:hypothetical protein
MKGLLRCTRHDSVRIMEAFVKLARLARWFITSPLLRPAALLCMGIIFVLSLLPGAERPHTGVSGNFEHVAAYAGTAFFCALGLSWLRGWRVVALAFAASGAFEIAQIWIPGRSAGLDNWAASGIGACIGLAAATLLQFIASRHSSS